MVRLTIDNDQINRGVLITEYIHMHVSVLVMIGFLEYPAYMFTSYPVFRKLYKL